MTLAIMVMMICGTIISQTSNSSSSGSIWARTNTKRCLEFPRQNLFRTVEKSRKSQTVWSPRCSKNYEKNATFSPFSSSWGNLPIYDNVHWAVFERKSSNCRLVKRQEDMKWNERFWFFFWIIQQFYFRRKPKKSTFENATWRKIVQLQPLWLNISFGGEFEETLQNSFWRETAQMQSMWLCFCPCSQFEDTFENTFWRKVT